jgi:hypothetical protein
MYDIKERLRAIVFTGIEKNGLQIQPICQGSEGQFAALYRREAGVAHCHLVFIKINAVEIQD